MIDIVEETFYISFDEPLLTRKKSSVQHSMRCGSYDADGSRAKYLQSDLVNSFQYHSYYLLHQFCRRKRVRQEVVSSRFSFGMYILLDGWGE